MQIPTATYRIQFGPLFGFRKARAIVDYLHDLGISHLYASPIFKPRKGSPHGYDVVDPNRLNPELGQSASFEALINALQARGMGWIQDIVPNHMTYDGANLFLADLFENGCASPYRRFFDIDWAHAAPELNGRVLAPFLGRPVDQCIANREIRLTYQDGGFYWAYYDHRFRLKAETYPCVLAPARAKLEERKEKRPDAAARLDAVVAEFAGLPDSPEYEERRNRIKKAKDDLRRLYRQSAVVRKAVKAALEAVNAANGDQRIASLRQTIWNGQVFRPAFWKSAGREINYRRFFSINELIALRQEEVAVFDQTHALILDFVRRGWFSGLRIDHIDGLADPGGYLRRVRRKAKQTYLAVEKILAPGEDLCPDWPVQGTTGYDFADRLNGLFCQSAQVVRFDKIHQRWCRGSSDFETQVYESKLQFLRQEMSGDLDNLTRLFQKAAQEMVPPGKISFDRLRSALSIFLSVFPVYRAYISPKGADRQSRRWVRQACAAALARAPSLKKEISLIRELLHCRPAGGTCLRKAVERLQQLSAPAAAKGVEDTALYRHHRLLSLNEVGGHPGRFGCPAAQFHDFILRRRKDWPYSINSTSTHDSKRSEDVRARINVLSEMPDRWRRHVAEWHRINRNRKVKLKHRLEPDRAMEYFLYQTLVGACPPDEDRLDAFRSRVSSYAVKAAREAKLKTSWLDPDNHYENILTCFVESLLEPGDENVFLKKFLPFLRTIAHYGSISALSQTLIKITTPGVPDFYQGTELPTFSLVDPDNRRPVDFALRKRRLAQIRAQHEADPLALIRRLLKNREEGTAKLFLTYAALQIRKRYRQLYLKGRYLPLTVAGQFSDHVIAFARQYADRWSLTLAPRFISGLVNSNDYPLGKSVWRDTICRLPAKAPSRWTDAFTLQQIKAAGVLRIGDAFHFFPTALLIGEKIS